MRYLLSFGGILLLITCLSVESSFALVPPTVTSVDPDEVFNNVSTTVKIYGTLFDSTSTVALNNTLLSDVTFSTATLLIATVPADVFSPSTYDVIVTNQSGAAKDTLLSGLRAIQGSTVTLTIPDTTVTPVPTVAPVTMPVYMANADSVRSIQLVIRYDPNRLDVTDVAPTPRVPTDAGFTVSWDTVRVGDKKEVRISVFDPAQVPEEVDYITAGTGAVVNITMNVDYVPASMVFVTEGEQITEVRRSDVLAYPLILEHGTFPPIVVSVDAPDSAEVNTQFEAQILVENAVDLGAYDFVLSFPAGIVRADSVKDVALTKAGRTVEGTTTIGADSVLVGVYTVGAGTGAEGNDTLATVYFTALAAQDTAVLDLHDVMLTDVPGYEFPIEAVNDDTVTVWEVPFRTISGKVSYYSDVINKAVPGVVLSLEEIGGGVVGTDTSGADGTYELQVGAGKSYRIVPSREGSDVSARKAVTMTDALYLLQFITNRRTVGLGNYNDYQVIASDIDEDNKKTMLEALYLLQWIVKKRLVFPAPSEVFWRFVAADSAFSPWPVTDLPVYTYASLDSDKVDQNYVAIHMGDTDGSWKTSMGKPVVYEPSGISVRLGGLQRSSDGRTMSALLSVDPVEDIFGANVEIRYAEGTLRAKDVLPTEFTEDYLLVSNLDDPGTVRFAILNADPLSGNREVPMAQIVFNIEDADADPGLRIVNVMLVNSDGDIPMESLEIRNDTWVPVVSSLSQNYPNPFNPQTAIDFSVSEVGPVSLRIYSSAGQLIRVLVDDPERSPGFYSVLWDGLDERGRDVGSGVYFCRMVAGSFNAVKKMILLR